MKDLEIVTEEIDALTIMSVRGQLDFKEVSRFKRQLTKTLSQKQYHIILDLSQLTFISSSGLGLLVSTIREIRAHGGDLKIGGVSERVGEIMETFGFDAIFDTFMTREDAIMKFKEI
jgi:anti-anti-sigma factor